MGIRRFGWFVRAAVCAVLFLSLAGLARAAGEWEWTAGQGWVQGAGVARGTPKEQLQYAYELEQRGEFMNSARQYFLLIQSFPDSQEAGVGLQRLARCLFEMENYYTSFQAIEQVIKDYPNTGRMSDLVEIELRIAKKLMVSQTPDILSGTVNPRDHNIRRAIEIVDAVIEHDSYGPVAAEAYLVKGEGHLFVSEIQAARTAFETIRDQFPRSEFIERARLGILTCDQLLGNANPQEVAEQVEVVRQAERERMERRRGEYEEEDDVEQFIQKQNEVEAAKMLDQADQYRQMGTRKTVDSSRFMYNEIVRRYPETPQAQEAMERLGKTKSPKEPSRIAQAVRNINLNPFVIGKDKEPPWIVPQMDPEDMVMVDTGLGPIAGVPETGTPLPPATAPGVRPATLPEVEEPQMAAATGNFSPAPRFVDGTVQAARPGASGPVPAPTPIGMPAAPAPSPNPLPGTENDLIGAPAGSRQNYFAPSQLAPIPELTPGYGQATSLGSPMWNSPDSDLVGPAPRANYYAQPPIPEYGTSDYITSDPQLGSYYAQPAPAPAYQDPMYQQPAPGYAVPGSLSPSPAYSGSSGSNGGWTFGEDFR